ncbi:MAG: ROK family transcriptional regulator [Bacillota bacterium]|nr:ROK family transcriptional regulator [Bacillota bacterium]HHT90136.1 ROK family transcriptional regulator [Bacillota bacterium]
MQHAYDVRDIRSNNVKDIISAVRFTDNITRREVAEICGLSFPTVANLTNELIKANILSETDLVVSRVGRTPKGLVFNYDRLFSVCLDLQLHGNLGFAILDLRNNVVFEQDYDISHLTSLDGIMGFANAILDQQEAISGAARESICGLGLSVSAIYDTVTHKLVNSSIAMFENQDIKEITSRYFDFPVYVDNESNLCALAVRSAKPDLKDAVYLHISEGVGVGVMAEGHLLRGKNGYAAEIAHIPIGDPKIKCPTCPAYGCVESELNIAGLIKSLPDLDCSEAASLQKWRKFVDHLHGSKGVTIAKDKGILLAKLASILVNLFDPEVLYLGGHISDIYAALEPYFLEELASRCPWWTVEKGVSVICDDDSARTRYTGIGETIYARWNPFSDGT